ncbi:DUF424 family protein [Candidatus Woesearchaeota archaeon]|nr:DUF424 family protein [Candidatus Woesearchaeota archaeon]
MIVKVHHDQGRKIVVIIDSDLLGKKFEEGNRQLDLTAEFYKGEEKSEKEVKGLVKGAYILHIVGRESVNVALKQGWIDEANILQIKGIPHAEAIAVENE